MAVLPDSRFGKIEFYELRLEPWTTNAVAIGTTTTAVSDLETKTTAARDAYEAHLAAQEAAKIATQTYHNAVNTMNEAGSVIIKAIKVKAETAGDSVYALAMLPEPASPSPKAPPGEPTALKVTLKPGGALDLKWKCPNPKGAAGTMYQVWRRLGVEGEYEYLGGAGQKQFYDASVPAGSAIVSYKIQGVRSTGAGDFAEFIVSLGTTSGGALKARVEPMMRKAA